MFWIVGGMVFLFDVFFLGIVVWEILKGYNENFLGFSLYDVVCGNYWIEYKV